MTHSNRHPRSLAPASALAAAALFALAACGDDPFSFNWSDVPDTVQIYSMARPELTLPNGFSFVPPPAAAIVELPNGTGTWDIAVDTRGGELVFLPPGALGITARARLTPISGVLFDEVVEAPADTLLYESNDPVPVVAGNVYVVSTNRQIGSFGSACVYYAKVEPVMIDATNGILKFRYVASPICNSRELTPPN